MLWTLVAVVIAGALAGTRYPAHAIVVLSFLAFSAAFATALITGWTFLGALGGAFTLTAVLQASFLMGTAFAFGRNQQRERCAQVERDAGLSEPTS